MKKIARLAAAALGLISASSLNAEWREASSTHFVVYGNETEATLRQFALNLERYHAAMAYLTGTPEEAPSPSNRVTIYAVGSSDQVRKLFGANASRYLAGFYQPRAGATLAIVPDITAEQVSDWDVSLQTVLHEYAHHFLIGRSSFPLPMWANEGAAEFYASASFGKDGSLSIGRPNPRRLLEANNLQNVPIQELLSGSASLVRDNKGYTAFYARAWLLYHFLALGGERKNQLKSYLEGLGTGRANIDAARDAFGDLVALDRDLEEYGRRPRLMTVFIAGSRLNPGPVSVRLLSEGEAATMTLRIQQRRGIEVSAAAGIAAQMRTFAKQYPQDAEVHAALAEAEHDAGNHAAAISAADAALALNPRTINAHVQKSLALMSIAGASRTVQDIERARMAMVALNRVENDHPLPLILYYETFSVLGTKPGPVAVQGLRRATELAPFDLGLRVMLVRQLLKEEKLEEAKLNLLPVAYSAHGGRMAERARTVLDQLAAGVSGAKAAEGLDRTAE
jgi:tetratricopeptide (TPR) repeat protein